MQLTRVWACISTLDRVLTAFARPCFVHTQAWVHSVGRVYNALTATKIDVIVMHCNVEPSLISTVAACAADEFPRVRYRLLHGCLDHPSRNTPTFRTATLTNNVVILRYLRTFSVYRLWELTEYERILFMDVDTILLKPVPNLRSKKYHNMVGCVKIEDGDICNTGVLVITPGAEMYTRIREALVRVETAGIFLLSDQSFFTAFFQGCVILLPRSYNFIAMTHSANWPWRVGLAEAFVFHYRSTLFKPIFLSQSNGSRVRYDVARPPPIYQIFHQHFEPMKNCVHTSQAASSILSGARRKLAARQNVKPAIRLKPLSDDGSERAKLVLQNISCRTVRG